MFRIVSRTIGIRRLLRSKPAATGCSATTALWKRAITSSNRKAVYASTGAVASALAVGGLHSGGEDKRDVKSAEPNANPSPSAVAPVGGAWYRNVPRSVPILGSAIPMFVLSNEVDLDRRRAHLFNLYDTVLDGKTAPLFHLWTSARYTSSAHYHTQVRHTANAAAYSWVTGLSAVGAAASAFITATAATFALPPIVVTLLPAAVATGVVAWYAAGSAQAFHIREADRYGQMHADWENLYLKANALVDKIETDCKTGNGDLREVTKNLGALFVEKIRLDNYLDSTTLQADYNKAEADLDLWWEESATKWTTLVKGAADVRRVQPAHRAAEDATYREEYKRLLSPEHPFFQLRAAAFVNYNSLLETNRSYEASASKAGFLTSFGGIGTVVAAAIAAWNTANGVPAPRVDALVKWVASAGALAWASSAYWKNESTKGSELYAKAGKQWMELHTRCQAFTSQLTWELNYPAMKPEDVRKQYQDLQELAAKIRSAHPIEALRVDAERMKNYTEQFNTKEKTRLTAILDKYKP